MKRFFYLVFCCSFLMACTVDNSDFDVIDNQLLSVNASIEIEGCTTTSFNFDNIGEIRVTNDATTLYVTVIGSGDNSLEQTKLHIAKTENGFPTEGNGNLPPGKMDYNLEFPPGQDSHPFRFPLSDFDGCIYIASQSRFGNGETSSTAWAGDKSGKFGKWLYFEYCIQECTPPCTPVDLGPDRIIEITQVKVESLKTDGQVKWHFLNPLGDVPQDGTFNPTIREIVELYNVKGYPNGEPGGPGDYVTEYTAGEGECADTVKLTLRIIPTPSS